MAAPKGNKNAVGNKGGGSYTVKEHAWHIGLWEGFKNGNGENQMWDIEELEKKITSKKYVGRDMYALRVLKGDPAMLKNLADKILADLKEINVQQKIKLSADEIALISKMFPDAEDHS